MTALRYYLIAHEVLFTYKKELSYSLDERGPGFFLRQRQRFCFPLQCPERLWYPADHRWHHSVESALSPGLLWNPQDWLQCSHFAIGALWNPQGGCSAHNTLLSEPYEIHKTGCSAHNTLLSEPYETHKAGCSAHNTLLSEPYETHKTGCSAHNTLLSEPYETHKTGCSVRNTLLS
jgi:hypothetical protein